MALGENVLALCRAARGRDAHAIGALADLLAERGDAALTAAAVRCLLGMGDGEGKSLADLFRAHRAPVRVSKLVGKLGRKLGIEPGQVTVEDLTAQTAADLLEFPNFGPTSLYQVRDILAGHDLRLRDD